jgi:prepilin-type N-terminal cleavage/methylation domain-containing protein
MKKQAGFSLIETTVAVALLGVIVVTILSAFSAVTIAAARHQQQTTLDRLTRSGAEYIKSQAYASTYLALAPLPAGYSLSYQVLYFGPGPTFSTLNPDIGLEEVVLTVTGPNSSSESLDFLKVQP